jgi:hypothetical protein
MTDAVTTLSTRLAELEARPIEKGERGIDGPPGSEGPPGPKGDSGELAPLPPDLAEQIANGAVVPSRRHQQRSRRCGGLPAWARRQQQLVPVYNDQPV